MNVCLTVHQSETGKLNKCSSERKEQELHCYVEAGREKDEDKDERYVVNEETLKANTWSNPRRILLFQSFIIVVFEIPTACNYRGNDTYIKEVAFLC